MSAKLFWTLLLGSVFLTASLNSQVYFFDHLVKDSYTWTMTVAAGDINGDSLPDIIGGAYSNDTIFWWENTGGLNFVEHVVDSDFGGCRVVDAGDMDDDGDLDVLATAGSADNMISWWENDGTGDFSEHVVTSTFQGGHTVHCTDLDQDDDMDILGSVWGGGCSFAWFENNGSQSFTFHPLDSSYSSCPCIYAEDINGDGHKDVIGCSYASSTILWWENDGNENFTKHVLTSTFSLAHWVYACDIDSDGDTDILGAAFGSGVVAWFENDGNENFTYNPLSPAYSGVTCVFASYVNDDSLIDILAAAENANTVTWWENNGNGTFTNHLISNSFGGASHVTTCDIDLDQDMDVLSAGRFANSIVLFENRDASDITDLHLAGFKVRGPSNSYHILPGEQGSLEFRLLCDTLYNTAESVFVVATVDNSTIQFIQDSCFMGNVNPGDTLDNSSNPFVFEVDDTVQTSWVDVTLHVFSDPQSLTDSIEVRFLVGEIPEICIVNADPSGNYLYKYIDPIENLGLICDVYNRFTEGPIGNLILDYEVVVWFTGDADSAVITPDDVSDLSMFLDSGKKLFLTGQNIAENLQGQQFLSEYLHCFWLGNTNTQACDGISGSIFDGLQIRTSGGQPSNQNSRDDLNPINGGTGLFQYWNSSSMAAVGYSGNYELVFFGFGFEAIYGTTLFAPPDTVMRRIMDYFSVGVEETGQFPFEFQIILSSPSIFRDCLDIRFEIPKGITGNVKIFDLTGREILSIGENLPEGEYHFPWNGRDVQGQKISCGTYIISLDCGISTLAKKVFFISN
ncbi:VCBS repeat-containing protein [candidate division WOR-3 bacterium]|nr:VCBS repeat-containing protein [candidate division WOR-3 bacterium]